MTQVIVLNGGSSSGKSGISRCLQEAMPDPWLAFGVDVLIEAMPAAMQTSKAGIEFAPDGAVLVGPVRAGPSPPRSGDRKAHLSAGTVTRHQTCTIRFLV
jgi:chloramphenicol 3-O-phosphotransferase